MLIQKGRGNVDIESTTTPYFSLECYRYKDSISNDIKEADLVISHAGLLLFHKINYENHLSAVVIGNYILLTKLP